jgi:hypothetical protein
MGLDPFREHTHFTDSSDTADTIDRFVENDDWRDAWMERLYITETIDRVTRQLDADSESVPADITTIDEYRRKEQKEIMELSNVDLPTVQKPCHEIFKGHEDPPEHVNQQKQWRVLFDLLIQKVHIYRSENLEVTPEKAEYLSDNKEDAWKEIQSH